MKKIILLLTALVLSTSLYTSSYFTKKGINVRDGILDDEDTPTITINTQCNDVNLSGAPYHYNGTVMSGYLKVNKGNSALAFIFYGR